MIYRERMTIVEMFDKVSKRNRNSSYSEAFVFPYIDRELSKEEEDALTSAVVSLTDKIRQKHA